MHKTYCQIYEATKGWGSSVPPICTCNGYGYDGGGGCGYPTPPPTLQVTLTLDEYCQVMSAMLDRMKVERKILTVEEYAKMVLLEVSKV